MKRIFDVICSLIGLIILSPLFAAVSLFIWINNGSPVIYTQVRIGRNFKPFVLYKFRTMVNDAHGLAITSSDDQRITGTGQLLRKTKIDELPQLINVIKGEMSLVGPRPEVEEYVHKFEKEYREILAVKPGMTDYAALEFINEEEILASCADSEKAYMEDILPRKIELYRFYLSNQGLTTDIAIILKTLLSSFGRVRAGS